jgi:hypothetical protein
MEVIFLSQTFVAKGMTTGQGSRERERRKKDRTRKPTENRPVPGEKEVVKPQVLPAFGPNGISNTYRLVGVDLHFAQHWNMLILRG